MDLSAFRIKFPEFESAGDPFVQAFLDTAEARVDADVWGAITDEGHGLLTAHLLALAPNGQFSRLQSAKGETTYGTEHKRLEKLVACGIRTI